MVKLDELPEGEARIDLGHLQRFIRILGGTVKLIALEEKWQEESAGKTGGLNITFKTEDNFMSPIDMDSKEGDEVETEYEEGLKITQKYGKMASGVLGPALEALGLSDTEELQKTFYIYELHGMRTGYPRLMPIEKA